MLIPTEEIQALTERLQALEWVFYQWQDFIMPRQVPAGLFRVPSGKQQPAVYFADIQRDLVQIKSTDELSAVHYLAKRIRQKINVLVYLYQTQASKLRLERQTIPSKFCTRSQWLKDLQEKRVHLKTQQTSLQMLYHQALEKDNKENAAQIKIALDDLEQHLQGLQEAI